MANAAEADALEVRRIAPAMGAEVTGIDLGEPLGGATLHA